MTNAENLDWLHRLKSEIYVYMPKEWLIPMGNALDDAIKARSEPTVSSSVIEKIKTYIHKEVMFRDLWHGEKDLVDYIDKVVKESTEDFDARLKQYLVENDLRIIPNCEWKDLNSKWKECLGDIRDIKTRINALEPSSTKSRPEPIKGYICDPKKNKECAKTACYERGGLCCLTLNPEYARENARPSTCKVVTREQHMTECHPRMDLLR